MHILGISAHYHDSAAALVSDGEIVAAAQEEVIVMFSLLMFLSGTGVAPLIYTLF
jgi:Carbamoyltransferase N-terminus